MKAENTAYTISQVKKKPKTEPTLSPFSENKLMLVKYGYLWIFKGLNQSWQAIPTTIFHYCCLIFLSLCLLILFLYMHSQIHTEGGEGRVWRESWWACRSWQWWHGSTTAGVSQHQSQLCRAMVFLGVWTLWVLKWPLPQREGNDLTKLHSLLFHNQNPILLL